MISLPRDEKPIFCPGCGQQHQVPQRYCKSCGCNLARISEVLSESSFNEGTALVREKFLRRILGGGLFSLAIVLVILWFVALTVGQINAGGLVPLAAIGSWIALMINLANWIVARHLKKVDLLKLNQYERRELGDSHQRSENDDLLRAGGVHEPASVAERTTALIAERAKQDQA